MKTIEKILEAVKELQQANPHDEGIQKWISDYFPELKESEDKRVRKHIIEIFKDNFSGEDTDKCIAWLEKQGEQNYKIIKGKNYFCVKTHNYAGVEWIKGTKYYASDNYTLVNQGCECYCPEYSKEEHNNLFEEVNCEECVEKQGEKNEEILILKDQIESLHAAIKALKEAHKIELKRQGEQKPTDKVEPKFKIGDKIRKKVPRSFDKDMQVARIEKDYYVCNNIGKFSSEVVPFSKEASYELIEQKPKFRVGDTIKSKYDDRQFTIKSVDLDKGTYTYTQEGCGNDIDYADEEFELVEQKSIKLNQRLLKGMNLVEEKMTPFQKKVFCIIDTAIEEEQGLKQVCDEILSLAHDEIMQKFAWSEEDKKVIHCLEYTVRHFYEDEDTIKWCCDWLKSLRPQNRWKPSDEQITWLCRAADDASKDSRMKQVLNELLSDLKKLREE